MVDFVLPNFRDGIQLNINTEHGVQVMLPREEGKTHYKTSPKLQLYLQAIATTAVLIRLS